MKINKPKPSGKPKTNGLLNLKFFFQAMVWAIIALILVVALWVIFGKFSVSNPEVVLANKLPDKITIGVLAIGANEKAREVEKLNYVELQKYLNERVKSQNPKTEVELNIVWITERDGLKAAKEKVARKDWDIAFTTEPFTSIAAIDFGYFFAARMIPPAPLLQTAVIVKPDSPIKSVSDMTLNTKLILGSPSSAALFYIPIYELYGTQFTKSEPRNRQKNFLEAAIEELDLKDGADAVAVLYGNDIKNNSEYKVVNDITTKISQGEYRIISLSRPILTGSVYISPKLEQQRNYLERLLFEVPDEIKQKAKYEFSKREEDYGFFRSVKNRVDTILSCAGIPRTSDQYNLQANNQCPETIEGGITSVRQQKNYIELIIRSDNIEYGIKISEDKLIEKLSAAISESGKPSIRRLYAELNKLQAKIANTVPSSTEGIKYFDFTAANANLSGFTLNTKNNANNRA